MAESGHSTVLTLCQTFCEECMPALSPSTMTWATWTPCGPNSLARDCESARVANLAGANAANWAEPFREAVAPVKMRVPPLLCLVIARRDSWANMKAPRLQCNATGGNEESEPVSCSLINLQ